MRTTVFNYPQLPVDVNRAVQSLSIENQELIDTRKQLRDQLRYRGIEVALILREQVTIATEHHQTLRILIDGQNCGPDRAYRQWESAITSYRTLAEQNARIRKHIARYERLLAE